MGKIVAIALNTFREAVRNKVLYFLLIFALLIMGFSSVISDLSIAAPEKLIKDLGLASIDFFGFLIAVFVGIYLVYTELDKKTIYTIVSKPISRWQFILGKYFGLLLTVYINIGIMTIFFFTVLYYRDASATEKMLKVLWTEVTPGDFQQVPNFSVMYYWFYLKCFLVSVGKAVATLFGYWEPLTHGLMRVIGMSALGLAIVTSFAILYSTFSTPTLSAVFTFLTWIAGSLCEDILRYADRLAEKAGGVQALAGPEMVKYWFAWVAMHITPNLALFDKRRDAIYGAWETATPDIHLVSIDRMSIVYGVVYVIGVLTLASVIFRKRNFK